MEPARELIFTGSPLELALPDVCARCGTTPAAGRLYWEKVFEHRDSEGGHSHHVAGARAPFCRACLAQHEREVKRMSPLEALIQCFRSEMMIPAVLSGGFGLWLLPRVLPKIATADWKDWAIFGGLMGFFGIISFGSGWAAWDATRHHTVPALTAVTRSFGFSREGSKTFEGIRHRYTLTNEAFYRALLEANRDRVWQPSGEQARAAAEKRIVLYVIIGILVAAAVVWGWLHPEQ
jgi:hypothetical protein